MNCLVTGGAGFIGSDIVARLIAEGGHVTVIDNLSTAEPHWDRRFHVELGPLGRLRFVRGDVTDLGLLDRVMPGHDSVIHLAANTDIPGGFVDPALDLNGCILGTWNVAEAMRRHGVRNLLYASSGVVYGAQRTPTDEAYGPLIPESHYAAAKLAGESILSGFAHLYGWRVLAFRFGNTIGPSSNHGVVHDFVVKLLRDPGRLEIFGDGNQAKPFIDVGDLVTGVLHAERYAPDRRFNVFNVATPGTLTVRRVAELVIESLGIDVDRVELTFTGATIGGGGWIGDTPHVDLDAGALSALDWQPSLDAEEAVRQTADGLRRRLLVSRAPLLTAAERRSHAASVAAR